MNIVVDLNLRSTSLHFHWKSDLHSWVHARRKNIATLIFVRHDIVCREIVFNLRLNSDFHIKLSCGNFELKAFFFFENSFVDAGNQIHLTKRYNMLGSLSHHSFPFFSCHQMCEFIIRRRNWIVIFDCSAPWFDSHRRRRKVQVEKCFSSNNTI